LDRCRKPAQFAAPAIVRSHRNFPVTGRGSHGFSAANLIARLCTAIILWNSS